MAAAQLGLVLGRERTEGRDVTEEVTIELMLDNN